MCSRPASNPRDTDHTRAILAPFPTTQCEACLAVFVTAPKQHFDTADGAWSPSVVNTTNISLGCKPLAAAPPPPSPPLTPRGRTRAPLPSESANLWRSDEALMLAPLFPHTVVLPAHRASAPLWNAHPGGKADPLVGIRFIHGERVRQSSIDCTHNCFSPFVLEPLWDALRIVLAHEGRSADG